MEMFLDYGVLVSGGLLLFVAFTSKTENFASAVLFKFLPFLMAVICIVKALQELGVIAVFVK